ncbi:MAG: asparagine synthase (glutamine-hydrolyzing) [Terriglobales bacterium]
MCGIAGFLEFRRNIDAGDMRHLVTRMSDRLAHRGPDDSGAWVDPKSGIALGHRRLSVLDLSPAGHQPMISASRRFVITFNGEIYNFSDLKTELEQFGHSFRGHSDTEVVLASFEQWGVSEAVKRFNGMFAFGVWDTHTQQLILGRDPLGKKTLYYGLMGSTFLFGSELKALRAHPAFAGTIDRNAIALYLRLNCIPAPHSIYREIRKLPAASVLEVRARGDVPQPLPYWSLANIAEAGISNPWSGSVEEAIDELERLLADAVRIRSIADVPLGAFLSGGIDSSLITVLMQRQQSRPVRTFSIGLENAALSEASYAEAIASHLGTEHTSLCVTPSEAMSVIPLMASIYDEPFSDSSQIPVYLVSQLARRSVTVALSGDGADESFGGYNRHTWIPAVWKRLGGVPSSIRSALAKCAMKISPQRWDRIYQTFAPLLSKDFRFVSTGDKIHKLARVAGSGSLEEMYLRLLSHWQNAEQVVLGADQDSEFIQSTVCATRNHADRMMLLDSLHYLHDDILVKVDRASMAVSLEARAPFLDKRVVSFAWSLPLDYKIRQGAGKWILREILHRHVPKELVDRPKSGFGIPLDEWLRGPLREWADTLLHPDRLKRRGFLDPVPIQHKWVQHLAGSKNWSYELWDILMLESWFDESDKASNAYTPEACAASC